MSAKGARRLAVVTYVAHPDAGKEWCVYCGVPATVRDHFYPRAAVSSWHGIMVSRHVRRLCFTVPACWECNALLGSRVALTFEGRREYLRQRLRRKYAARLKAPRWTKAEQAKLRGMLKTHVAARQMERDLILARLSYEHPKAIGPLPERVTVTKYEAREAEQAA